MKHIFDAFCDHWIDVPEQEFKKPINYVMAKNGCFEVRETPLGQITVRTEDIPSLKHKMEEGVTLYIPEIPGRILTTVIEFFRAVYKERNGAEAFLQIFYDREEEEYFLFCPKQKVSSALVVFERDPELEARHMLVMDIHSHNSMPAFFSATDDADEQEDRLYGVVGCLHRRIPQLEFRAGAAGRFVALQGKSLFGPPEAAIPWPNEWLERCLQSRFAPHKEWGTMWGQEWSTWGQDEDDAPLPSYSWSAPRHSLPPQPQKRYRKRTRKRVESWGDGWDKVFSDAGPWEEDVEVYPSLKDPHKKWFYS